MIRVTAASSRCGSTTNDDFVLAEPAAGLALVVDGMGGVVTGVLAARLVADAIRRCVLAGGERDPAALLRAALAQANALVLETAAREGANLDPAGLDAAGRDVLAMARAGRGTLAGMSASCVVALVRDRTAAIAHVGTCRAYRLASHTAVLLTADHSLAAVLPQQPHARSIPTRALGITTTVEPELTRHVLADDEHLLLACGDIQHALLASDRSDALIARLLGSVTRGSAAVALVTPDREPSSSCANDDAF